MNMDCTKDKPRAAEPLMLYIAWSGDSCHKRFSGGLFLCIALVPLRVDSLCHSLTSVHKGRPDLFRRHVDPSNQEMGEAMHCKQTLIKLLLRARCSSHCHRDTTIIQIVHRQGNQGRKR